MLDVVYVLGPNEGYEEFRYSLRSLANVPHGQVWVFGCCPRWARNVHHVRVPQDQGRFRNSTANMVAACATAEVSSSFTFWHDDMFALKPTTVPVLHKGRITDVPAARPSHRLRSPSHGDGLASTAWLLSAWGIPEPYNYDLHIPMPVDKDAMGEVLRAAEPAGIECLHKRTLYGNVVGIGGHLHKDVKVTRMAGPSFGPDAVWVSTSDQAFARGRVGQDLRALFPEPSPYEEQGA